LLRYFFFSSRRRHTRSKRDWSSDVCSSDLAAKEKGIDADIFATAASDARAQLDSKTIDCVLLGPQVSYMQDDFKSMLEGRKNSLGNDIPLAVIVMKTYGKMDGGKDLRQGINL